MGASVAGWVDARASDAVPSSAAADAANCRAPADECRPFDIPPQPLDRAIEAFGAATGLAMIYDSALTRGQHSPGVRGAMPVAHAVAQLLEGSGLAVRRTGEGTFLLVRDTAPVRSSAAGDGAHHDAALQQAVSRRFCECAPLAEGRHRLALRFWFDADGRLRRHELLEPTGDAAFDAVLADALDGLSLGMPVDAGVPQPFTMLVLPREAGYGWSCPRPRHAAVAAQECGR